MAGKSRRSRRPKRSRWAKRKRQDRAKGHPMQKEIEGAVDIYCGIMQSVKNRLDLVSKITVDGYLISGSEYHTYEFVAIQLRKVLESVAFGSLCANRKEYAENYNNSRNEWRAKRILDNLERMHPRFYPEPLQQFVTKPDGEKHFPGVEDGFMDRNEFEELYNICSAAIHATNPFSGRTSIDFRLPVQEWVNRIRSLLNIHRMNLAGTETVWVVYMNGQGGKVQAFTAVPTEHAVRP